MKTPTIDHYGRGTRGVYVDLGHIGLYFSYKTLIGFQAKGCMPVLIQNYWGSTTGAHLNIIAGKKCDRLTREAFAEAFADAMSQAVPV